MSDTVHGMLNGMLKMIEAAMTMFYFLMKSTNAVHERENKKGW